ncbi:MAG: Crp/Fnr family transcriptional regulator [Sedimenticola sp.]
MQKESINNLPPYLTDKLLSCTREIVLKKGDRLFLTGDKVEGIYYVIEGELKAIRPMLKEGDAVMVRSRSGEYFAETALAIDHYVCDAYSSKPSTIAFMPKVNIFEALKENQFALGFSLALAANARRQCSRYERLRLHRAKDRLLHLLTCESDKAGSLNWQSPLSELAADLAIEPETLYRVLSELEKNGVILREKRSIKLLRKT